MEKKLDKIINRESINFNSWTDLINNYLEIRHSDEELKAGERWKVTLGCVNSFSKITELCIEFGGFKDTWEYENFYQNIYGPELIIKSTKTDCVFKIGLDGKGVYLSTDLCHYENIRHMGDEFWKLLLSLYDFEGFIYEEYEFVNDIRRKQFPDLFNTNKSMVYRILRKYIFDSTETNISYVSSSVGELKIQWGSNFDFESIVRNCCLGFKVMYQLNYYLWKITDLKNKKNGF